MDGITPSSRGEIQIRGEQMTAADKMLAVKRREKEKEGRVVKLEWGDENFEEDLKNSQDLVRSEKKKKN